MLRGIKVVVDTAAEIERTAETQTGITHVKDYIHLKGVHSKYPVKNS